MKLFVLFTTLAAVSSLRLSPSKPTSSQYTVSRGQFLTGASAAVAAAIFFPKEAQAGLGNPAQAGGSWGRSSGKKGGGAGMGSYVPGKGMRSKEDDILLSGLGNPAQAGGSWGRSSGKKGGGAGMGSYVPGKGMRSRDNDVLVAGLGNPAQAGGSWGRSSGKKGGGAGMGSYVPGKGMRNREELS